MVLSAEKTYIPFYLPEAWCFRKNSLPNSADDAPGWKHHYRRTETDGKTGFSGFYSLNKKVMRPVFYTALLILVSTACSDPDVSVSKSIEKAAQKTLEEKLGRDVKAKMTSDGIVISRNGAEYTISFSVKDSSTSSRKRPPDDLPLFPGALVTDYFRGAGEDTIRLSASGTVEEIGRFYQEALKKRGFVKKSSIMGDGDFSGSWILPGSNIGVHIYTFEEGDRTQIVMIVSRARGLKEG